MSEFLKKLGSAIGGAAGAAGAFLKNNKKLVAAGLYGLIRIFPEYTFMGGATKFMHENLEIVQVGLDIAFSALGAKGAHEIKNNLPSGLRSKPPQSSDNGEQK